MNKIRLSGGPFVTPEYHADVCCRAINNGTSIGQEIESDGDKAKLYDKTKEAKDAAKAAMKLQKQSKKQLTK